MKNILIVLTVLAMASAANATLMISVNGVVNPDDTTIELLPSQHAVIDIHGDAQTPPGVFVLGVSAGDLGKLDPTGGTILYLGNKVELHFEDAPDVAGGLGIDNPLVLVMLTDVSPTPLPLEGLLVDNIDFHCTGLIDDQPTDVTLMLFDGLGNLLDTQVIHQIPEPMTMVLLGLGGLFLRRRK